jgi:branched-subunit amino acid transport protein
VNPIWAVIAAATLGVVLPKLLPALLLPETVPARVATWLEYLPAAMLGAFTALLVAGFARPSPRPWLLYIALVIAAATALVTRRTLASLLAGWSALIALHLAGAV